MNFAKLISLCIILSCFYVLWQIRQLLLLLLAAIVLAIGLNIFVKYLQKWRVKREYAVLLSVLLLLGLLFGFISLIIPSFIIQFQELIKLIPLGIQKLIFEINKIKENLSPELTNSLPNSSQLISQLQPLINKLVGRSLNFVSVILGGLLSSLLLFALTLMLLIEPASYRQGFIRLFPFFYRSRIEQILNLCQNNLEEWLTDIFLKMFTVSLLIFCGLFLLNIRLVFAQAILAGILTFIPYIGPLISVTSSVAIAILAAPWKPWFVVILYILSAQITEKLIIPKLRKNRLSLMPVAIILGEIFFAGFLGILGLFLSFPLTIISQILIKEILIKDILNQWELNN